MLPLIIGLIWGTISASVFSTENWIAGILKMLKTLVDDVGLDCKSTNFWLSKSVLDKFSKSAPASDNLNLLSSILWT